MKFKFHIVPQEHPLVRYQHESVALCEGLKELGHEFFGTDNYWVDPASGEYLIKKGLPHFRSDVDIYSTYYFRAFPGAIDKVDHSKVNVFIDREDGLYGEYGNPRLRKFHLILRTHYNKNINYEYYNPNIKPWAFGLSNRIVEAIDQYVQVPVLDRTFVSFRVGHDLRSMAANKMSPVISGKYPVFERVTIGLADKDPIHLQSKADKLNWLQSGHRHDPEYYKLMNSSSLTYAFGGFMFIKPFATNRIVRQLQNFYRIKASLLRSLGREDSGCYFIDQFDSWRLWESLYSNTCPIHMDFDHWGWVLPVMPVNKVHYWGVSGFKFKESAEELLSLSNESIQKIAKAGRQWAVNNYSPKATAQRFLDLIDKHK